MKQYLELLQDILDNGNHRGDRTGTGTQSVFGRQVRFDLQKGFPLVTTKKLHMKSIIHELLWFLRGDTSVQYLQDNEVRIWNEWSTPEQCAKQGRAPGDIGPMYGHAWRAWPQDSVELVQPRCGEPETAELQRWPLRTAAQPNRANSPVGAIRRNRDGLEFQIVSAEEREGDRDTYTIQFQDTGYVRAGVSAPQTREGASLKDPYFPSIFGVACMGEAELSSDFERGMYQTWFAMVRRCYDPRHPAYAQYGGRGVFVCAEWLTYSQFRKSAERVQGWRERRLNPKGIQLDKDYYSSNCYSPTTCVWLSAAENAAYTGTAVEVTLASGEVRRYLSRREAAREIGVSTPSLKKAEDTGEAVCGVRVKRLEGPYRRVRAVDQIDYVVKRLRTNPECRRLIVTAWNPSNYGKVALESCHCLFQFYTREMTPLQRVTWLNANLGVDPTAPAAYTRMRLREFSPARMLMGIEGAEQEAAAHCDKYNVPTRFLDCQLYQRSADVFLGVPFNIASYALLTMMVAQQVDMLPGEFVHTFGDVHIYANHRKQVELQLSRQPKALPQMHIKKAEDIFSYKFEDFSLAWYDPHPSIKAEVAV